MYFGLHTAQRKAGQNGRRHFAESRAEGKQTENQTAFIIYKPLFLKNGFE